MDLSQEAKIGLFVVAMILTTITGLFLKGKSWNVNVIYFHNPGCRMSNQTTPIISDILLEFGSRISLNSVKIDLDGNENYSQEVMDLKEKYNVVGVPTIIINGKEYDGKMTKDGIERGICKRFLIKPKAC